jgi:riboflavin synthase
MFTGLIESTVPIVSLDNKDGNLRLCIEYPHNLSKVKMGDSISLNGVCLTISDIQERKLCVEIVQETAATSNMTDRTVGDLVNLERSLKVGDELGGHFLTGHIDGTGIIKKVRKVGGSITIWVSVPPELARFIVRKGSLGLEGVSLTVVDIEDYVLSVVIIPFTGNVTSLGAKTKGDRLNIEVDVLGKHVHKSVQDILGDGRDLIRS